MKIYTTLGYIFNYKMFHQEASVETIKIINDYKGRYEIQRGTVNVVFCVKLLHEL